MAGVLGHGAAGQGPGLQGELPHDGEALLRGIEPALVVPWLFSQSIKAHRPGAAILERLVLRGSGHLVDYIV
jgi:hypothetical protein